MTTEITDKILKKIYFNRPKSIKSEKIHKELNKEINVSIDEIKLSLDKLVDENIIIETYHEQYDTGSPIPYSQAYKVTYKGVDIMQEGGYEKVVLHKKLIKELEESKLKAENKFTKNSNRSLWANFLFALVSTIFIVFTWWDSHTDATSSELQNIKTELEKMRLQMSTQPAKDTLQIKIPTDTLAESKRG